jgi:hypothetical protein
MCKIRNKKRWACAVASDERRTEHRRIRIKISVTLKFTITVTVTVVRVTVTAILIRIRTVAARLFHNDSYDVMTVKETDIHLLLREGGWRRT